MEIPYNQYTDEELMALIQNEDAAAFTEIYERYWHNLLSIAWNHIHDSDVAEDIVHEVFLSLWEKKTCQLNICNAAGFLAVKTKYVIFNYLRRQKRRTMLFEANYVYEKESFDEEKWDALFMEEYIHGVVEQLPEKCKMVFKFSRWEGMKNIEIAMQMQISEKGVEANLTRALKLIKGKLAISFALLLHITYLVRDYFP
ncbi:MAG: sigma-70 family RNA polymerase sigma factor [Sphingobacteriaceae bacterium]|nr:MAG: sigma-70 family RNA polymerase sigma factor [Sphingobacteriaceae bacterium]